MEQETLISQRTRPRATYVALSTTMQTYEGSFSVRYSRSVSSF